MASRMMAGWPKSSWARVLLPALVAPWLSGCAGDSAPGATQACTIRKAADIPISFEGGFIAAAAEINHKPVTMLIDTGAERSMVTPSAKAALALASDPRNRTTIHGVGGTITTQNATLQSLGIGGMEMLDQSASVGPLPVLQGPALHASGLLGADWLSDFDVEFDLPHRRMALYRVHGCAPDYVPWQGGAVSTRIQLYGSGLPLLPVLVEGHHVSAMLDSGASSSSLGREAAERIGVTQTALAGDRHGHSVGVDGAVMDAYRHRFGEMQIGDARYPSPDISISPIRTPMADMLLGLDWLRNNRVWIDYSRAPVGDRTACLERNRFR